VSNFIKAYATDYGIFKKRFVDAGLGSALDAKSAWRHLLGSNKYFKEKTLRDLKNANLYLKDLTALKFLVKGFIIK